MRRHALFIVLALVASPSLQAQDDLLAPLTPSRARTKAKPRLKKRVKQRVRRTSSVGRPIAAPAQRKTELLVTVDGGVEGATLFVDGEEKGVLPQAPLQLVPGEHLIQVRREGYGEFSERLPVPEGRLTEVKAKLEGQSGTLALVVNVDEAEVQVDGVELGRTPLQPVPLGGGAHELKITKDGYLTEATLVQIRPGREHQLTFYLRPSPVPLAAARQPMLLPVDGRAPPAAPIIATTEVDVRRRIERPASPAWYGRWYVWAGAAVIASAAVGAVVLMASGRSLAPDAVCGGACDAVLQGAF